MTKLRVFFCVIIQFLTISSHTFTQHENIIDSLQSLTPQDRKRAVFGYMESAADLLGLEGQRALFFRKVEEFALQNKDKELLEQLRFIERMQEDLMNYPIEERKQKSLKYIEKLKNSDDLYFLAICHHELGQIYFKEQKYASAFDNALRALEIYEKIGYDNVPNIGKVLHEVALNYYFFRDYEEVIRLMKTSLQFPPHSRGLDIQRYNNLGMSYKNLNKIDSANYFFNQALEVATRYKSDIWIGILHGSIGEIHYQKANYDSSLVYSRYNYQYNKSENRHTSVKINSYVNMAKVYLKLDSIEQSAKFLEMAKNSIAELENSAIFIGGRQQFEISKRNYFEVNINYLKAVKDFQLATQFQDSLMEIREDIEKKYNVFVGKMAQDRLIIQNNKTQLTQKEKEQTEQKLLYYRMLLFIVVVGGVVFYYFQRAKKIRERQNEKLIEQNKVLGIEKEQAIKDLESAQNNIDLFILKVNEQNRILSEFEEDLKELRKTETDNSSQITETLNLMKQSKILTNDDWLDFQNNFDTVFSGFREAIKKKHPAVTPAEMRYLLLVKLNFSHKEMARALGISNAAVRVTWNRVRKKLNGTLEDTPTILVERITESIDR